MTGRVLVTGGAGFIGSHVVDVLLASGYEPVVLDSVHPLAHHGREPSVPSAVQFIRGDLRDADVVEHAINGVHAVSHQAAMVGLGVDFGDVVDYVTNNDTGTAVLLRALAQCGFRGRFVLASSMVVYGEGRYRCADHGAVRPASRKEARLQTGIFDPPCPMCGGPLTGEPIGEDAPLAPRNVYAATKLHQEHLAFSFGRECRASVVALRYHNVYGPRMPRDTPYAGVASIFRSALESHHPPEVFEDGHQLRDFIHVSDVARANVSALSGDAVSGAFNVATGDPRSIGDMAHALADAFGPDAPRPVITGGYRLGDVRHVFASPDKAARELGFRAEVAFDQGMREFAHAPLRAG